MSQSLRVFYATWITCSWGGTSRPRLWESIRFIAWISATRTPFYRICVNLSTETPPWSNTWTRWGIAFSNYMMPTCSLRWDSSSFWITHSWRSYTLSSNGNTLYLTTRKYKLASTTYLRLEKVKERASGTICSCLSMPSTCGLRLFRGFVAMITIVPLLAPRMNQRSPPISNQLKTYSFRCRET